MLKTNIWANFQRIIELCTQKIVTKLSKIWVWDPGSKKPIPDPGSRGQKGNGSRIVIRDTLIYVEHSELGLEMHDQLCIQSVGSCRDE